MKKHYIRKKRIGEFNEIGKSLLYAVNGILKVFFVSKIAWSSNKIAVDFSILNRSRSYSITLVFLLTGWRVSNCRTYLTLPSGFLLHLDIDFYKENDTFLVNMYNETAVSSHALLVHLWLTFFYPFAFDHGQNEIL